MIRCPNCNREQPDSVFTCDCGFNLQVYAEKREAERRKHNTVTRPYQVLPILLLVLRLIGILSMLGGLIYGFSLYAQEESAWLMAGAFLGGILAGLPYFALSEALIILLHMSEKQDKMILALEKIEEKG